jgi:hypothetical protein
MHIKYFELKANISSPEVLRGTFIGLSAEYKGCDQQVDTYF